MNDRRVKESNPKDSIGIKKVPFSTISGAVMAEIGLAMLEGARKYGRHNYRAVGVRTSVYYDACLRHIVAYWEGQDIDPESGLSHITKAMACLMVLRDAQIQDKCHDDRPPKVPHDWVKQYNEQAKQIIEQYPDAKEAFTEKNKKENEV